MRDDRKVATRPNETWAMDFVHDQLATGRKIRVPCSCSMIKSSPGHAKIASFFAIEAATSASTIVPSKALGEPINLTYTEFRPLGYRTSRKRSLAPNMEVAIGSRSHE